MSARELTIEGRRISDGDDCYVIAEIGHNHQGDLEKARELFRAAKECGADAVKLQKRDNRALYTAQMYAKAYENENSFGRTYGEHREFLEFGRSQYQELRRYARELGLGFFATAFDEPSADFLRELEMPAYKLASGDLKNLPLIQHVASFGVPLLVSTGGGTMDDVRRVYDAVMPINPRLCFLQCTMSYPTDAHEMNLRVIPSLREAFPDLVIGLSDHFNGIVMSAAAYVLGARVIEKHFTLNHALKGTDHALSLEPSGLRKLTRDLKRLRLALGDGTKRVYPSEISAIGKMGKALVAARDLPAGHTITRADLAAKSPGGGGLPPFEVERVLGRRLLQPMRADQLFSVEHLD